MDSYCLYLSWRSFEIIRVYLMIFESRSIQLMGDGGGRGVQFTGETETKRKKRICTYALIIYICLNKTPSQMREKKGD